jgi:hypothetical protein
MSVSGPPQLSLATAVAVLGRPEPAGARPASHSRFPPARHRVRKFIVRCSRTAGGSSLEIHSGRSPRVPTPRGAEAAGPMALQGSGNPRAGGVQVVNLKYICVDLLPVFWTDDCWKIPV